MSNKVLRQYGVAAPSSLIPVIHPEDVQPNERGTRGNQKAPPMISVTSAPPGGHSGIHIRGGHRGPMHRGGPFMQYAVPGNGSWRARGRGGVSGTNRTLRYPDMDQYREHNAPALRSSSKQPMIRQESDSTWHARNSVFEASTSTGVSVNMTSSHQSTDTPAVKTSTEIVAPYRLLHPLPNRPSLPLNISKTEGPRRQEERVPTKFQPPKPSLSPVQAFREETRSDIGDTRNVSINPSAPKPSQIPQWLLRSRSPSPMLPPSPLKRRKIAHDFALSTSTPAVIESAYIGDSASANKIANPKPCIALPGRRTTSVPPKPATSVSIKEETTPVKLTSGPGRPIKQEVESPPPVEPLVLAPVRNLITESTNFYPMPAPCKKSNPDFAKNRRSYFIGRNRELLGLGLKKTKAFWRDDGLVIEWSSTMPVWSDTLKPDIPDLATAITRANELNSMNLPKSPKRKKVASAAKDISSTSRASNTEAANSAQNAPKHKQSESVGSDNVNMDIVEVIDLVENVRETGESPGKKARKHWATGISSEELRRSINLAFASSSTQPPEHSTPKQKKCEPLARDIISPINMEIIEVIDSVRKAGEPPKKAGKHWAAGLSSEVLHRSTNLALASSTEAPEQNTARRFPLPTRLRCAKPASTTSEPTPFTVPDPSAALPSQEWRAAANKADTSASRLTFKPSNPRKGQGTTEKAFGTALTGTPDTMSNSREYANVAQRSSHGGPPPSDRACPREKTTLSSTLMRASRPPTQRDRSTPDHARSPTLVDESMAETNMYVQTTGPSNSVPEFVSSADFVGDGHDKGGDRGQCLNPDSIALDLIGGTTDVADMDLSSDSDESLDEETENSVKEFISKYATLFDSDRRNLKKAYVKGALFSCRVHDPTPNSCASLFIPERREAFRSTHSKASASRVLQGRTRICDELMSLGQYQYIPRGVAQNFLYTWSIPKCPGVQDGILLSLHGEVVKTEADPALDHRLTVDQIFLLRQRTDDDDADDDDGTDVPGQMHLKNFWPLAVVSHQMTARSIPLLDIDNLQSPLEWVRNILE